MFTHVSREEGEALLHISHLHHYVSAYHTSKEDVDLLVSMIEEALVEAEASRESVIVNRDGEMCFHAHPNGSLTLMVPWKHYRIVRD